MKVDLAELVGIQMAVVEVILVVAVAVAVHRQKEELVDLG
jgi:hypothetical protein